MIDSNDMIIASDQGKKSLANQNRVFLTTEQYVAEVALVGQKI